MTSVLFALRRAAMFTALMGLSLAIYALAISVPASAVPF